MEWWVFAVVFILLSLAGLVYALRVPHWYQSSGVLRVETYARTEALAKDSAAEWKRTVEMASADATVAEVAKRLTVVEQAAFLRSAGYTVSDGNPALIERLLKERRQIKVDDPTRTLTIQFQAADRWMAARIINFFIDEVIAATARDRIDGALQAVVDLKARAEAREQAVNDLANKMADYRSAQILKTSSPFESDEAYRVLEKQRNEAQQRLDDVVQEMKAAPVAPSRETSKFRAVERAVPAAEGDYLLASTFVRMAWGFGIAFIGGVIAVGGVRVARRRTERDDRSI